MNSETKKRVAWGSSIVAVLVFIGLVIWLFATPEDAPVVPPTKPAPCVCPTPELPPTLPETGRSL